MKIRPLVLPAILVLCLTAAVAQEPAPVPAPDAPSLSASPSPTPVPKPGVYDYQDLPIDDVLRDLGREAKINLVIGNNVGGNLTFHIEKKTALEVIDSIAEARNLLFKNFEGVYYIVTPDDWHEIMRNRFYFEVPELPVALAKYEKRYYDALVKEGFTKEEALKIIMSQSLPPRDLSFPR